MSTRKSSAFRLNLEQQKKRAKELLRAAHAGNPAALARLAAHGSQSSARPSAAGKAVWRLADAQLTVARELRFASWARLVAHAASMERQRQAIEAGAPAPDAGPTTLHLRCGSDIQATLRQAGFTGDFLEHSVPYSMGPVSAGPLRHERMARFLVEAFPHARGGLEYERERAGLEEGERALLHSAQAYERVVLWMEHDPWDQLILARLLAAYAGAPRPRLLELVLVSEFPGPARFIGLGQLPPEALRALWAARTPVKAAQLPLGQEVWAALCADSPQRLAALARSGTPALPVMAPALHRHLQELPWIEDGMGLTRRLILETVAQRCMTLHELFRLLKERDPLPSITDLALLHIVGDMLRAVEPPLLRTAAAPGGDFAQPLTITAAGAAVLAGERDFGSLGPPSWWVGGTQATPGQTGWRWHESAQEAVWRS
jgi:hypothetical protein